MSETQPSSLPWSPSSSIGSSECSAAGPDAPAAAGGAAELPFADRCSFDGRSSPTLYEDLRFGLEAGGGAPFISEEAAGAECVDSGRGVGGPAGEGDDGCPAVLGAGVTFGAVDDHVDVDRAEEDSRVFVAGGRFDGRQGAIVVVLVQ